MRGGRELLRLGEHLVRQACAGLPEDTREERYREWVAELPAILHDPEVRFAPRRAVRMLAYAADTQRGAGIPSGGAIDPLPRMSLGLELLFLGVGLIGAAVNIWVAVLAPGDVTCYLNLAWCLFLAAAFTGRLAHASARITMALLLGFVLALEPLTSGIRYRRQETG